MDFGESGIVKMKSVIHLSAAEERTQSDEGCSRMPVGHGHVND
jgi:hypothetical protein